MAESFVLSFQVVDEQVFLIGDLVELRVEFGDICLLLLEQVLQFVDAVSQIQDSGVFVHEFTSEMAVFQFVLFRFFGRERIAMFEFAQIDLDLYFLVLCVDELLLQVDGEAFMFEFFIGPPEILFLGHGIFHEGVIFPD